mmetsp:Transcript_51105/g.160353  ORF Transcript_51105/g.160353 Transcript_51105/m.160353 type:complete len:286 (-) Transcript_51105:19-876(-)
MGAWDGWWDGGWDGSWGAQPRAAAGNWRRWREGEDRNWQQRMEVSGDESSFSGRKINAVQIGLGTFGTVIQNLIGSHEEWDPIVGWLMEVVSERNPRRFQGVAVEPVREHIERLRKQAANQLPHFRLVQAAIGEDDVEDVEMTVLTKTAHDKLLASVPPDVQQQLARDLVYIRNMSCVGGPHPGFDLCRQKAWRKFGVDICLEPFRTSVWSYGRLARSLDFCGCELFIVDAEGHDTQILRSMIQHCSEEEMYGRCAWPDVVVFESAGLCDSKEGAGPGGARGRSR